MKKLIFLILIFAQIKIIAGIVDTVSIPSEVMQKEYKAVIVFPDKYFADLDEYWPVVYLLHGWSGKYSDWIRNADLAPLSDKYEFIHHILNLTAPQD